jgi:dTDP-4-dehydrorhamnose 3,5-epimerase
MIFIPTGLEGAFVVEPEQMADHRGFFARTWCEETFAAHGLPAHVSQCSIAFNHRKGTLRGMHYQEAPYGEAKLVRCTMGAIYDVIVDLRPASPTFRRHVGVELTALNRRQLFVPEGFAHGYQTLEDNTEVFYQMNVPYAPSAGRGVRWDDPAFGIVWPDDDRTINERDRQWPDYSWEV